MIDDSRTRELSLQTRYNDQEKVNREQHIVAVAELEKQKDAMQVYQKQVSDKEALREQLATAERELIASLEESVQQKDEENARLQALLSANAQTLDDMQSTMSEQAHAAERRTFDMEARHVGMLLGGATTMSTASKHKSC